MILSRKQKDSPLKISDKGLMARIYKEIVQLNNKKTTNSIKNGFEQVFFQRKCTNDQESYAWILNIIIH